MTQSTNQMAAKINGGEALETKMLTQYQYISFVVQYQGMKKIVQNQTWSDQGFLQEYYRKNW